MGGLNACDSMTYCFSEFALQHGHYCNHIIVAYVFEIDFMLSMDLHDHTSKLPLVCSLSLPCSHQVSIGEPDNEDEAAPPLGTWQANTAPSDMGAWQQPSSTWLG